MTRLLSYVPRPVYEVHQARYRVCPNDTPTSIARAFGRPALDYAELVGANLHKRVTGVGSLPGHAVLFEDLRVGEELFVPAWWTPKHHQGQLGDPVVNLDTVTSYFASVYPSLWLLKKNGPAAWQAAVVNASAQWWAQENPNVVPIGGVNGSSGPPSDYMDSALAWMTLYGQKMPIASADTIPWTAVPWKQVPFTSVPWLAYNWTAVSAWALPIVQPGMVMNDTSSPGWSTMMWDRNIWANSSDWADVPWMTLPFYAVPWTSIPWAKINWPAANSTDALLAEIKRNLPASACADCGPPPPKTPKQQPPPPKQDPPKEQPPANKKPPATDPNAPAPGMSTAEKVVIAATVVGVAIGAGNLCLSATEKKKPPRKPTRRGPRS